MKYILSLFILCAFFGAGLNAQQTNKTVVDSEKRQDTQLRPMSDHEADMIVQQKADEKELRESQRLINRIDFTVLERKSVNMGDKKVILNRVAPPNLPQSAPSAPKEPVELTEAEFAELMKLHEKPHRALMLSATVYDRKLTKLRWGHGENEVTAWSNVDFNYLRGVVDFETEEAFYTVFLGIGNESIKELNQRNRLARKEKWENYVVEEIPKLPPFTANRAEYFVITDNDEIISQDDLFAPIDSIHAFYEQNARKLHIQYQRTEALNSARKRYEEANPEQPKDTVIHFWPKRSAYNNENR